MLFHTYFLFSFAMFFSVLALLYERDPIWIAAIAISGTIASVAKKKYEASPEYIDLYQINKRD